MGIQFRNFLLLFLFWLSWLSWGNPPIPGEIVLIRGEQRWIHVEGLKQFSLGGPEVRSLGTAGSRDPERILLKAVQPGRSSLWIRKQDGTTEIRSIRVEAWDAVGGKIPKVWEAAGALQETESLPSGEKVLFRGRVGNRTEWMKLRSILRAYSDATIDETEWDPALWREFDRETLAFLSKHPDLSTLRWIQASPESRILEGTLKDPLQKKRIHSWFAGLFPKVKLDLDGFSDGARTVFFRVFLLEMKRESLTSFGLSWPEGVENAFQVTPLAIRTNLEFPLTLQALESKGELRVLSNPELAVRTPGEAELFAGGEIPIKHVTHSTMQVIWKAYGLLLKLKVTEQTENQVRLEISTEMSHLDTATGTGDIPGLKSSKLKTQVDARISEPLFLSGLLQENIREQGKGLPWLRSIPILGTLFGSQDYWNMKSELVAILLPHRAPPPAPMERVGGSVPKGPLPPPRNWISPGKKAELESSPSYPWNAF